MFKVKCRNDRWSVNPRQLQNKDRPLEFKAFIIFFFLGTDADTMSHVFLWTFFSTQTFIQLTDWQKNKASTLPVGFGGAVILPFTQENLKESNITQNSRFGTELP